MLDIGWSEMALVALVALIVIGPKELPQTMRSATKWIRKARSLAREFQSGVDDMVREADLEDARKAIQTTKNFDVEKTLEQTIDPTGDVRDEVKDLENTAQVEEPDSQPVESPDNSAAPVEVINEKTAVAEPPLEPPLEAASAQSTPPSVEDSSEADAGGGASKRA